MKASMIFCRVLPAALLVPAVPAAGDPVEVPLPDAAF
jgi:hypothetical protein